MDYEMKKEEILKGRGTRRWEKTRDQPMIITDFLLLDVQKEMDNDHLNTFSLFLFSFVLFFEKPIASIFKYTQKGKKILKGGVCRGGGG